MRYSNYLCYVSILFVLTAGQSAQARLAAIYEQSIITIDQIIEECEIITSDGEKFYISSPELIKSVELSKGQQIRIQYTQTADKNVIKKIKTETTHPFMLPKRINKPADDALK